MQALELISFSGNPYLVSSLICNLALSGNAKARKSCLLCSYILALREPAKRQNLPPPKFCLFAQRKNKKSKIFQGVER